MAMIETQFIEDEQVEQTDESSPNIWGRLLSANSICSSYDLVKDEYTIGRRATTDIVIADTAISNVHCKIFRAPAPNSTAPEDLVVFIQDSSANGTYVGGERLAKNSNRALKHGDEIKLTSKAGGPCFVFHDLAAERRHDESPVYKKYNFSKKLGSGACGEVWLGINKATGAHFAIKIIQKKKFSRYGSGGGDVNLIAEVDILAKLNHPNVIRIYEMFDMPEALYIVLELAKGGELFDRIIDKEKLSEHETKMVFLQLLRAVKYLHQHGVAHRDLKPENILLDRKDTSALVKVTDFGLAKLVGPQSFMKTMCGTPSYQAPEVLIGSDQGYSTSVDLWSLGVILYIMLCGFPPFSEDITWNEKSYSVNEQITRGIFSFPAPYWDGISEQAKDLIRRLLTVDAKARINIDDALAHPFMQEAAVLKHVDALVTQYAARDSVIAPNPSLAAAAPAPAPAATPTPMLVTPAPTPTTPAATTAATAAAPAVDVATTILDEDEEGEDKRATDAPSREGKRKADDEDDTIASVAKQSNLS